MSNNNRNVRGRAKSRGAGIVVGLLVAAALVGAPVSLAFADDPGGFLVETGMHPDAGALGAANSLVLKDGNGGLRLTDCATAVSPVVVERTLDGRLSKVCFAAVFRPAVLNLEIDSSFGVKAGKQPVEVTYSIAGGDEQQTLVPAGGRKSVDTANTGESTVVVLEVSADPALDTPATVQTNPRTAVTKVRTGFGSCSGTLVDRQWVLTAASCFVASPDQFGTLTDSAPADPARVLFGPEAANDKSLVGGPSDLGIAITRLVPAGGDQDAVLARLAQPVDDIPPMPFARAAPAVGDGLTFTGYGRTSAAWVPLVPRTVALPVATVADTTVIATGSGESLCVGDGGAPGIRDVNGSPALAAVASRASQGACLGSGVPVGTPSVTAVRADALAVWTATTVQKDLDTTPVSAEAQTAAQQLLGSGRVTGGPEAMAQLQAYAEGKVRARIVDHTARDCAIDPVLLTGLRDVVVDRGFSLSISSLNEYCLGTPSDHPETDYHRLGGGGHAVDIDAVNGVAATGDTAEDRALIEAMFSALPASVGLGQIACRAPLAVPVGWLQIEGACTHDHFEYRGAPRAGVDASFDVDGDGKHDVLGITAGNVLTAFLGDAAGWWSTATVSPGWDAATVMIHGDYNGDRKGDVMTVDAAGSLWFSANRGATSFLPKARVGSGWNTKSLITGGIDFNNDKKADLVARDSDGTLFLYPGNGDGTFGERSQIGVGWGSMVKLLSGDFTGDGKGDILAITNSGVLSLYPGNGSVLANGPQVGSGWTTMTVLTGGLDYGLDGTADLLGRDSGGDLWLYPGLGIAGFGTKIKVGTGWNSLRLVS